MVVASSIQSHTDDTRSAVGPMRTISGNKRLTSTISNFVLAMHSFSAIATYAARPG